MEQNRSEPVTDDRWQAILGNDSACDGQFVYAVATTGVFCRPSCKSRPPRRENVRVFRLPAQAQEAGYRPCKRCRPTGERLPDDEWTTLIKAYIDGHYPERLTLDTLAEAAHGSPYHLQRTFKRITGRTPSDYIQRVRIGQACELLLHTDWAVAEIGARVGLPNTPYFITLFRKLTGYTPAGYRRACPIPTAEVHDNEHSS